MYTLDLSTGQWPADVQRVSQTINMCPQIYDHNYPLVWLKVYWLNFYICS